MRLSLRRAAHDNAEVAAALRYPSLAEHRRARDEAGRVTVIGRAALAVVVQAINGNAGRAHAERVRARQRENLRLELPVRVGLDDRAFGGVRRVEVRALGAERGAEEAAYRRASTRHVRVDVERF